MEIDPSYPGKEEYRVAAHTLERVLSVLNQTFIETPGDFQQRGLTRAPEVFLGYLMLDALIGNTDRHHENWGVLRSEGSPRRAVLAPSFDHASSLGRNLADEERLGRLETRDAGYRVPVFVRRARSPFYAATEHKRRLAPLEVFQEACKKLPRASEYWLAIARTVDRGLLKAPLDRVPDAVMTQVARRFAQAMVAANLDNVTMTTSP